jgi:ankyrin repeat protein
LFQAVDSGNVHELKSIVDSNPELEIKDVRRNGKTLLHVAVFHHHLDCIQYILELGMDANVKDNMGNILLMNIFGNKLKDRICLKSHNPKCLESQLTLLLKYKMDINARSGVLNRTALLKSVLKKHRLSKLLLQHGADPNLADKDGLLPIHVCATSSRLHLLKLILECGADINSQDRTGRTALYLSVMSGHQDIFDELIFRKCDINKGSRSRYQYPLQAAVAKGRLEMVQILLEKGASASKVNYLQLALKAAHQKATTEDLDKAKRSFEILDLIIQAVSEKIDRNVIVKTECWHFEDESLLSFKTLLQRKLAFLYKMNKNSEPIDEFPQLIQDIDTISLKNICRMKVRQLLSNSRSNIIFTVDQLKYPRLLKDLILLKDL